MGHLCGAGPQQRAHQIWAGAAEHKYVVLILDRAQAVEQPGARFRWLQRQSGRRVTRRARRTDMRQHGRRLLAGAMLGPDWSKVMAGRKIGDAAYNTNPPID